MTSDTATSNDVAVIGMAVRLPEADDLSQLFANLSAGRDSIREVSAERRARTSLSADESYRPFGYIDDIDSFDHAFFGFAKREADNMAPEHRMLLQTAYQAVENAGYAPGSLLGTRGSVYVGDTKVMYDELAATYEPTMVMGSHVSAMAGRLSRLFGLRGPAAMVDSACSSSLNAVYMAVNDLILNEAEIALVACASLDLFPARVTGEPDIGIRSADGRTRSFSAEADGTGSGEAVATVVLKRLDRALRDGDVVHAVIKGVAVNNVGGRSSTLTAPDADAETEVIERAWARAGIDPRSVTYIEAHGTATRLGDPIEIEALDTAFRRVTSERHVCAVSSVKSNFGHTWGASGLVGMIKAILSLRHGVLFPSLHSATPSPFIDFDRSAVIVTQQTGPWRPACGVRRAGVSSFGIMGTNVHAVLEEPPAADASTLNDIAPVWLPISAHGQRALDANIIALRRWIEEHPEISLADVQRTLVAGRDHHTYRACVVADDRAALLLALDAPSLAADPAPDALVLLVSDTCTASDELTGALRAQFAAFDAAYDECTRAAADPAHPLARQFAFRYAFVVLLRGVGLAFAHIVGEGSGRLVVDAAQGRTSVAQALQDACSRGDVSRHPSDDFDARVDRLLARFTGQRVCFVEAGPLATVSRSIQEREIPGLRALTAGNSADGFARLLRALYLAGASWTWQTTAGPGCRTELPSYQFDRTRCWIDDVRVAAPAALAGGPADPADAQRGDTLTTVSVVWSDVLGEGIPGPDDSFFDLGGDSISGLQMVNRLRTMLGVDLDDLVFFDHETPRALARCIDALLTPDAADPGEPGDSVGGVFPAGAEQTLASAAQRQIWLASQFEGGSVAFNLTRSFELTGRVDVEALRRAVADVACRHDALRTRFTFDEGQVQQQVTPADEHADLLELLDATAPAPQDVAGLGEASRSFAGRPFDLAAGPLLRAQLLQFDPGHALLTLSTHHIVADGWSLELIVRDLADSYETFVHGATPVRPPVEAAPPAQVPVEEQRSAERLEKATRYWLERFADLPAPLDLPERQDGLSPAFSGSYRTYSLPDGLWPRVQEFARSENGTPFGCLLSVLAAMFSQHSESGDLVLGTSIAGRGSQSSEQLVGMLVRTVPLRVSVGDKTSLRDLFAATRSELRDAVANLAYPYELLVEELQRRSIASTPDLFQVLVEYEHFAGVSGDPHEAMTRTGLGVTPVDVTLETSVFPLNIMLSEQSSGLVGVVRFDTRKFDERTVDHLWDAFTDLLAILLDVPGVPLGQLPLLRVTEHERVRTLGHRTADLDTTATIPRTLERLATEHPDRLCVSGPGAQRTCGELNARANQLARHLVGCGVRPGDVVALVMDRSVLTIESILAVWKCGAAYLPVDPKNPAAFVDTVVRSSGASAVGYDPAQTPRALAEHLRDMWGAVELTSSTGTDELADDLGITVDPDALAYVIFTSGSTGAPKGAMVEHLGMLNHLHAKISDLSLTDRSVVVQNASNSFDISVWQMFAAPFVGGQTVIYDQSLQVDPVRMADRLAVDGVTVFEVVPSYLEALLDAWDEGPRSERPELNTLKYLMVTGEAAHPRLVNRWLQNFPGVPVVNAYGPTEASDDVTHHLITEPVLASSVPLGRPIPNTLVYVLDAHSRVVPQGVAGEICVSGVCVGRGYLGAPDETARVFGTDPFQSERRMYRTGDRGRWDADGTLQYLGRTDNQVKVRGFRVDLGEIERRVTQAPGVRSAAVVVPARTRDLLCAYVVVEPGYSAARCRAHLVHELPAHMVPADVVEVAALPLTANGKVDRNELRRRGVPTADARTSAVVAPQSHTERVLQLVWQDVLGRPVDVGSSFFDLGGNSLRAIQVLARIRARLGVDITLEQLFSRPTVAALAELVAGTAREEQGTIPQLGGAGRYDVAPTQPLLLHVELVTGRPDAFARNDLYEVQGPLDVELLAAAFAAVVRRHEALRTTFETDVGGPVQVVRALDDPALSFRVHDLRGSDADLFVRARLREPFNIAIDPLVRADLMRTGESGWTLLISIHQLVSDGRSAQVLHDDLLTAYDLLAAGQDLTGWNDVVQYKDVARWRADRLTPERVTELRTFWLAELDGASSELPLTVDHPRPSVTEMNGTRLHLDVPVEVSAGLTALARRCAVTEFVIVRAALALLLCAQTGATDGVVGTYTRGRNRIDLEDSLGFYINTVPLRLRISLDQDLDTLLAESQRAALRAFAHEEHPYEWTMRDLGWVRGNDRPPLFDVMLAMDWDDEQDLPHQLRLVPQEIPRRSKEGDLLVVFIRTGDRLELQLTYDTAIFNAARAQRFASSLQSVLAAVVARMAPSDIVRAHA